MKDNLPENTEEKIEYKSLEERILDDIESHNFDESHNGTETQEENKKSEPQESPKIEEQKTAEEVKPIQPAQAESNYQINLINENLLRIKVKTKKGVNIDCSVKDMKTLTETQSNRLYLHPKPTDEIQEVEIVISIDPNTGEVIVEKKKDELNQLNSSSSLLTPNPDVQNLIMPIDLGRSDEQVIPLTEDEILQEKIGKRNPFLLGRLVYRRNMTIGIISAVVFACICTILFYNFYGKTDTKVLQPEKRLVVINDIPVKINFKEYEDPNKPKEEPKPPTTPDPNAPPTIKKNIIRAPKINRPKINTNADSNLTKDATKELDSLRKLNANNDSLKKADSLKNVNNFTGIPDSSRKGFSENELGLSLSYPGNWKVIDMRNIDKSVEKFKGVILTDTTAKESGTANIFIALDNEGKDYNPAEFKTEFKMNDSSSTAYVNEPRTQAGSTNLRFFIFLKTDKLSVNAQIKKQYFDQYKPLIEAIVKTINIIPPQQPPTPK